jgi:hypothetical protein
VRHLQVQEINYPLFEVAWIAGGEDSVAFQTEGISAIGFGLKPTDPNQRGIHTPDDLKDSDCLARFLAISSIITTPEALSTAPGNLNPFGSSPT